MLHNRSALPQRPSLPDAGQQDFALKIVSYQLLLPAMVAAQLAVIWLSTKGTVFPEVDAFQSIVGSFAEIIAGLYGITMAGYTFFLSRMDGLTATDSTLDYIVDSVKKRFKRLAWYITANVVVVLFTSIVLMYSPTPTDEQQLFWYRLFCNEFVLSVGSSILLILYYSVLVVDPNCLEREAAKLKKRLCRSRGAAGSAVEFIALYDRIETRCSALLPTSVLHQLHENKGRRFEPVLQLLYTQQPALRQALTQSERVHRYYECMVNSSPMTVPQEMCALARQTLAELERQSEG